MTLRRRLDRVWAFLDEVAEHGRDPTWRGRALWPVYLLRVGLQIGRHWVRDKCPQAAASLAYETSLSLVPVCAVAFALLKATGALRARSALIGFLSAEVLPTWRHALAVRVTTFADHIGVRALGTTGLVSMIAIAYLLFHTVDGIYNDVWHVEQGRSLARKLLIFFAVATLVPFFLGLSLAYAVPAWHHGRASAFAAYAAAVAGLTLQNKLLPATRVKWRPALVGGLVSGTGLEIAKRLFRYYVVHIAFARYSGVYGPLGLVALLLVWIYVGWVIVLFGAEIAHSAQNLSSLERIGPDPAGLVSGPVAVRTLVTLVRAQRKGNDAPRAVALAEHLGVPRHVVEDVLVRLRSHGYVERHRDGWRLARRPQAIPVLDVLDAFRGRDLRSSEGDAVDRLLAGLAAEEKRIAGPVTLDALADAVPRIALSP